LFYDVINVHLVLTCSEKSLKIQLPSPISIPGILNGKTLPQAVSGSLVMGMAMKLQEEE
jgi:hypothetical protein